MYSILLVDDETKIREGIKNCFPWKELGFRICGEARDGAEAIQLIEEIRPEIVLTDVVMPKISGIDLSMKIYEMKLQTKVVLLSGHKEFDYAQRALAYGVFRYLLKPIDYDELVSVFSSLHELLNMEKQAKLESCEADESAYDRLISKIKVYVEGNIKTATLQGAAAEAGLSVSYLSRMFKRRVGINFSDFLVSTKMRHAKGLLMDYNYLIYEIAEQVGYDSARNFSRAFKNHLGMTPQEYRENPRLAEVLR